MFIKGAKVIRFPQLPAASPMKITQLSTCFLSTEEIDAAESAYRALALAAKNDPTFVTCVFANGIFFDRDELNIDFSDAPDVRGNIVLFFFLPVHRWRADHYTVLQMETAILEELCHAFFQIEEEGDPIKLKVTEVMQHSHPGIAVNDLFACQ